MVRRQVGYFRYDTRRELDLLNQLWPLSSLQVNLFLPQQKLATKTRTGAVVRKTYDTAATPRSGCSPTTPTWSTTTRQRLTDLLHGTDILAVRHQIADIQGNLTELARRRGLVQRRAKTNATYLSHRKISLPKRAKQDESTNQSAS